MHDKFPGNYTSYIAASYVKHVEAAGARVVPIKWVLCVNYRTSIMFYREQGRTANLTGCESAGIAGRSVRLQPECRLVIKEHSVYRFNKCCSCSGVLQGYAQIIQDLLCFKSFICIFAMTTKNATCFESKHNTVFTFWTSHYNSKGAGSEFLSKFSCLAAEQAYTRYRWEPVRLT
jgi:hypothetical protein